MLADQHATARYIGAMAVELRGLASDAGHDLLAHLLDMVVEEADQVEQEPVRADKATG